MTNMIDITGQRFGRLVVKSVVPPKRQDREFTKGGTRWLCACDCGAEHIARSDMLRRGDTKSCGCLRKRLPCEAVHDMA